MKVSQVRLHGAAVVAYLRPWPVDTSRELSVVRSELGVVTVERRRTRHLLAVRADTPPAAVAGARTDDLVEGRSEDHTSGPPIESRDAARVEVLLADVYERRREQPHASRREPLLVGVAILRVKDMYEHASICKKAAASP